MMRALWLLLTLCSAPAAAAQFYSLKVSHEGDVYRMSADAHLAAPPEQVYRVLTDYAHLTRVSSSVVKSDVVRQLDATTALVYTDARVCNFLFCRHARELQRIVQDSPRDLSSQVVPQPDNNIRAGSATLHIEADGDGARLRWELDVQPDFWVPPLIGPPLMLGSLRSEGVRIIEGVERMARAHAHLPPLGPNRDDGETQDPDPR